MDHAVQAKPGQFVAGLLLASGACPRITGLSGCRMQAIDPSLKLQDWMGSKGVCDRWGAISVRSGCQCKVGHRTSQRCGWAFPEGTVFTPRKGNCEPQFCSWWFDSCKCKSTGVIFQEADHGRLPTTDVGIAAVDFCSRLFEEVTKQELENGNVEYGQAHINLGSLPQKLGGSVNRSLEDHNAEQYCEAALSGRNGRTGARLAVDQLLHHVSDQQPTTTKAPPRYAEIVKIEEEPEEDNSDTSSWQHSLGEVCREECKEILAAVKEESRNILIQEVTRVEPFESTCSDFVVKRVEAHLMGCCEKACGWNGKACTYWPFMKQPSKVRWHQECCSEWPGE